MTDARRARASGDAGAAAARLREAIGLFRGPPLADVPLQGALAFERDRLDGLRLAALEERLEDRARARRARRGRRGAARARRRAPIPRAPARPLRARAVPLGPAGGRARGVPADPAHAGRRPRARPRPRPPAPGGGDPRAGPGAGSRRAGAIVPTGRPPARRGGPARAADAAARPRARARGRRGAAAHSRRAPGHADGPGRHRQDPARAGARAAARRRRSPTAPRSSRWPRSPSPARVPPAIAERARRRRRRRPSSALAGRELLLVLDNFEQVLAAAPELAGLLAAAPRSQLLVTSRAVLRIAGRARARRCRRSRPDAAVDLFEERARARDARARRPRRRRVERICRRLDGLPLAIELAAARVERAHPGGDPRPARAPARPAAAPARATRRSASRRCGRRSTGATTCSTPTRGAVRAVGVFAGGWTVEAAEAVCGPDALDGLGGAGRPEPRRALAAERFAMLETLREYALERLAEARRVDEVRRARAASSRWPRTAEARLHGPESRAWLERLDADHDNLLAAIEPRARRRRRRDGAAPVRRAVALLAHARATSPTGRRLLAAALAAARRHADRAHAGADGRRDPRRRGGRPRRRRERISRRRSRSRASSGDAYWRNRLAPTSGRSRCSRATTRRRSAATRPRWPRPEDDRGAA